MQYTNELLKELQAMPLEQKIEVSKDRIEDWYMQFQGNVSVSFSGGKDSTVLLHLVRSMYPDVPAVFYDTGLEYPELRQFVNEIENVVFIRPKMTFPEVIKTYGYPIVSKEVAEAIHQARKRTKNKTKVRRRYLTSNCEMNDRGSTLISFEATGNKEKWTLSKQGELCGQRFDKVDGGTPKKSRFNKEKWFKLAVFAPYKISDYCCDIMKKKPSAGYHAVTKRVPYIGTLAEESKLRKQAWLRHGCNAFHSQKQTSSPLSFWTEQDILHYIKLNNLKVAPVYGDLVSARKDDQLLFDLDDNTDLKFTGCQRTGCVFCGFGAHLEKGESRFQLLKKTHPQLYRYCIDGGEWIDNPDYDPSLSPEPDEIGWIEWNPKQLWIPNSKGLGMGKVFDIGNELYGKEMWRY